MKPSAQSGLLTALILALTLASGPLHPAFAETAITPINEIIELERKPAGKVQLSKPVDSLGTPAEALSKIERDRLSPQDAQNLSTLWESVVSRNPVIQYGLKQLATPPELRYAHSSVMSRTIGGLLAGASMLPYVFGADQITRGASSIGANLVDRAMTQSQKIDPSQLPSDTELVELSGLVQNLRKGLFESYFQYKNSLTSYVQLETLLSRQQNQYHDAIQTQRPLESLFLKQQCDATESQMLELRQTAKRNYLVLERLVGKADIQKLQFNTTKTVSTPINQPQTSQEPHVEPQVTLQ